MIYSSPRGFSNIGLRNILLAEIEAMLDRDLHIEYQYALEWIQEQIRKRMNS